MIRVLVVFLLNFLSNGLLPKQPRNESAFEFGDPPQQFCANHNFLELPMRLRNIWTSPQDYKFNDDKTEIEWLKLTESGLQNSTGVIWYNQAIDFRNGFVSEFNMELSNTTCSFREQSVCRQELFGVCIWEFKTQVETNCGADGFAFVLQQTSPQMIGGRGSGLGYTSALNALAIEFDTNYNEELNDPANKIKRHISIILKKGEADANEINSIAWNDKPLNFASKRLESFLENPRIRIEYLNKNIRVFINNVLQVGYYDPLDLVRELELNDGRFFMGITASSSVSTNDQILRNWKIFLVRPSPSLSFAVPNFGDKGEIVQANELFTVSIYLKDQCNNTYLPIEHYDYFTDIALDFQTNICSIFDKNMPSALSDIESKPSFLLTIKCIKGGEHFLQFTYKNEKIKGPIKVKVAGSSPESVEVVFVPPQLTMGDIDNNFIFKVVFYDALGQKTKSSEDFLRENINVEWPKPPYYRSECIDIKASSDSSYQISVKAEELGRYKIVIRLKLSPKGENFFNIGVGEVDPKNSFATIIQSFPNITQAKSTVAVGTGINIMIFFRDRKNHPVPTAKIDQNQIAVSLNTSRELLSLSNSYIYRDTLTFFTIYTISGYNSLRATYKDKQLSCNCSAIFVEAGPGNLKSSKLMQYNEAQKSFSEEGPDFNIKKGAFFSFLFIFQDIYGNRGRDFDPTNFAASLSGNHMKAIVLCLSNIPDGLQIKLCDSDVNAFNRLVGRENYLITVRKLDCEDERSWFLNIVSDGSDSRAGNGPLSPENTKYFWIDYPAQLLRATAGTTYSAYIKLFTKEGLRYNDWLPDGNLTTPVEIPLDSALGEQVEPLQKWTKPGVYILKFNLRKAQAQNKIFIEVNGVRSPEFIALEVVNAPASRAKIVTQLEGSNNLKDGNVYENYVFEVKLTDAYGNEAGAMTFLLSEIFVSRKDSATSIYKPNCRRKGRGLYECEFLTEQNGDFIINSNYFSKEPIGFYTLYMSRGVADVAKTTASIITSIDRLLDPGIEAGSSITLKINARDKLGRDLSKREIDENLDAYVVTLLKPGGSVDEVSIKQTQQGSIEYAVVPTRVGPYRFTIYIKGTGVQCAFCAFTMIASQIDLEKVILGTIKSEEFSAVALDKVLVLDNSEEAPAFSLRFYDKYNNPRELEEGFAPFAVTLKVSNSSSKREAYSFATVIRQGLPRFLIDNNDEYLSEFSNEACSLEIESKLHTDGRKIRIQVPKVTLTGSSYYSNMYTNDAPAPEAVRFSPENLNFVAGNAAQFTIELRATNGKLYAHPNTQGWYQRLDDGSLKIKFKQEQNYIENVDFTKGKLKGTYLARVTSTKAFDSAEIELTFVNPEDNKQYVAKNALVVTVHPGPISQLLPTNSKNEAVLSDLPSHTVDFEYSFYLRALDFFGNFIALSADKDLQLEIKQADNKIAFSKQFLPIGIVLISFQPKIPSQYSALLSAGKTIQIQITQGEISAEKSSATLDILAGAEVEAGEAVRLLIYPFDKWGNKIVLDDETIRKNVFGYSFKLPSSELFATDSFNKQIVAADRSHIAFSQSVNIKGAYVFRASINAIQVKVNIDTVTVKPAAVDHAQTILSSMDESSKQYNILNREALINVDNNNTIPIFRIQVRDKYLNKYENFPPEIIKDFEMTLSGNLIPTSGPVKFSSDGVFGDSLQFTLNKEASNVKIFQTALYRDTPYDLVISQNTRKIQYKLILLGEGQADKEATVGEPGDVKKFWFSTQNIQLVAGDYVQFVVEVRTAGGKRLAEANAEWSFKFEEADKSNNGKYRAVTSPGDLRGRFVISVTAVKANEQVGDTVLTVIFNGEEVPLKVFVKVVPGALSKVVLAREWTSVGSADDDFPFELIPLDKSGNVVIATEKQMNVDISFPLINGIKPEPEYIFNVNSRNGFLEYKVKSRIAGDYKIICGLLDNGKAYSFNIVAGVPNWKYSSVSVAPTSILAGEQIDVKVTPFDSFNNRISPRSQLNLISVFLFSVEFESKLNLGSLNVEGEFLVGKFSFNKIGKAHVLVQISTTSLPCTTCSIDIISAEVDISKTEFSEELTAIKYVGLQVFPFIYGCSGINLKAELFDKFSNPISILFPNQTFTMRMRGNNMDPLNFDVKICDIADLKIESKADDASIVKRLVPGKGYILEFRYVNNDKKIDESVQLFLEINGEDTGAGNGPYILSKTFFSAVSFELKAGTEALFYFELRTSESKRFNGVFENRELSLSETSDSPGPEKLTLSVYSGDYNNQFKVGAKGTKALARGQSKKILIKVKNEEIPQRIAVSISPGVPDNTLTKLINIPPGTGIKAGVVFRLNFEIFDAYGNKFESAGAAPLIYAQLGGKSNATFQEVFLEEDSGSFFMNFVPNYPPRALDFSLFYRLNEKTSLALNKESITTLVLTDLDPAKTEIISKLKSPIPAGEEIIFTVLLIDTVGYCYESAEDVIVYITGPFISNDFRDMSINEKVNRFDRVYNAQPVVVTEINELSSLDLVRNGYKCKKYFEVSAPKGDISKVGWYQLEAYLYCISDKNPIKAMRDTLITPAATDPQKSVIVMPSLAGKAPETFSVTASTKILFNLWNFDKFENRISENRVDNAGASAGTPDSFDFKINNFVLTKDYSKEIKLIGNGTWSLVIQVYKSGALDEMVFIINSYDIKYSLLGKKDCPQSIIVTPEKCSSKFARVDKDSVAQVIIGEKKQFLVDCRDEFDNDVVSGGDKIEAKILGKNILGSGDIDVPTNVDDSRDGSYHISFTITSAGTYEVSLLVNDQPYSTSFNIVAVPRVACPENKPFVCVNIKELTCVASYKECGLPILDCPTSEYPIRCKVWGMEQCMRGSWECDCPNQDMMKCDTDQKCVDANLYNDLCSTITFIECPTEFPSKCPDGSCRINLDNCPSQPGCPPSFRLCPDLSCAQLESTCPAFEACPVEKLYKCHDQSCTENPNECPTKITCPSVGQVVCPDQTCATSELQCKIPTVCGSGLILCLDQTCKKSRDECPGSIVCPLGYAKCFDGQCRKDCIARLEK